MRKEIKHIRIDGRLIHGQVVTKWIFVTNINRIIIVDNDVLDNVVEKNALKISTPSHVKLSILGVETVVKNINNGKYEGQNVMILVKVPKYLRMLAEAGLDMTKINVGNISQKNDSVQVKASVFLSIEDVEDIKYLISRGVSVTTQMVPSDQEEDMQVLLDKL
ncbi:MAG: PTS sugar transporter subunit IIB [Spirochaetota bacterium]|nr:PTS sugar transporter subunit IIB [Spirochaetota bacterium]